MSDTLALAWFRMSEATPDTRMSKVYLKNALEIDPDRIQKIYLTRRREQLPEQVRTRDYRGARDTIQQLTEVLGWQETLMDLKRITDGSLLLQAKIRDVLFHTFGMGPVGGMDIDPLKEFSSFDTHDFLGLKHRLLELVVSLLRKQIARKNTFYLDVDELRDSSFVVIIPEVLEARKSEILELPNEPSLNQIFATYYGYSILTQAKDVEQGRTAFEKATITMGKEVSVQGKRLSFKNGVWSHTSTVMQELLKNTARLSLVQSEAIKVRAIRELGASGDSRVRKVLKESNPRWSLQRPVGEALGMIGRETEYETQVQ